MNVHVDYLVIGSGASAMAFVDTILTETDKTVAMVDRRAVPGGHWNDAYPFVRLHQPAAFYGVNSKPLGRGRIESDGLNAGMYELSTGVEIVSYYHDLMNDVFLPSGRVTYFPLTDHVGDGEIESLLSGDRTTIKHDTIVDATRLGSSIPSLHTRRFEVADDVVCIPPNQLPHLVGSHDHVTVLGGGKTGVDAVTWLVSNGWAPEAISWVVPRDSWFLNRRQFQPGMDFFGDVFNGLVGENEATGEATTVEEVCLGVEASGRWRRVDPDVWPTMFHAALLSDGELECLRSVDDVIRGKRVARIEADMLTFDDGTTQLAGASLYVDCTASAAAANVGDVAPVFEEGRINLQMIRHFQICFSAALIAFIEANITDDATRQSMTQPTPMTDTIEDFLGRKAVDDMNYAAWNADERVALWIGESRLDFPSTLLAQVAPDDVDKMGILGRLMASAPPARERLASILATPTAADPNS